MTDSVSRFGLQIAEGCLFEGSTHTTESVCAWHRDVQNPPPEEVDVSSITTVYKRFEDGRVLTSVYYFRNSVSLNIVFNNNADPLRDHFVASYKSYPAKR